MAFGLLLSTSESFHSICIAMLFIQLRIMAALRARRTSWRLSGRNATFLYNHAFSSLDCSFSSIYAHATCLIRPTFYFVLMAFFLVASAIFQLLTVEAAASSNDTAQDERVGWVPSRPGRSTMQIIWSCVSVLIVCSYKCVHLNISSFEENRAGWHKIRGIPYWPEWPLMRKSLRKIKWMAIILLAPEIGVVLAFDQYLDARRKLRWLQNVSPSLGLTITHGFYDDMHGFAFDANRGPVEENGNQETKTQAEDRQPVLSVVSLFDFRE
jgi:hypothetical protein